LTSSFRRRPESRYTFSQQGTAAVQSTFLGSGFRRNDGQKLSPRHALAKEGKLDAIALTVRVLALHYQMPLIFLMPALAWSCPSRRGGKP
jgi:hypothetical protein